MTDSRFGRVLGLQLADNASEGQAAAFEKDEQVEDEVSGFGNDFVVGFDNGGQRDFQASFANLLRNAPGPAANRRAV